MVVRLRMTGLAGIAELDDLPADYIRDIILEMADQVKGRAGQ